MSADLNPGSDSKRAQGVAVIAALREGARTTAQLRDILGPSASPAARVLDLRKAGQRIVTQRAGRQALYVLLPSDGGTA